jgi:hypothetical protein
VGLSTATCLQESDPFFVRSSSVNLNSQASYRHGGSGPLTTNLVKTPLIKKLIGDVTETWSQTDSRY